MEKEAAAIDTRDPLDNLVFKSSIARSDMLLITFGNSIGISFCVSFNYGNLMCYIIPFIACKFIKIK